MFSILYLLHCILCIVFGIFYFVYCILCIVFSVKYPSKKTEPGTLCSPPFVMFFTLTFTSTEVPLFFDKYGSVIYGWDRIFEAFDLAPILGEISGLSLQSRGQNVSK